MEDTRNMKPAKNIHRIIRVLSAFLLLVASLSACVSSDRYSHSTIKSDFQNIQNGIDSGMYATEKDLQLAYAELFQKISKGLEAETDQLAELVRTITNAAIEFDNSEVFSLAGDYARLFSNLAKGKTELGIQDISIYLKNNTQAVVEISYLGEARYSTNMITAGENWNNGEELVPYDNELGEYLLEISLYDSAHSCKFSEKYPHGSVHNLGISFSNSNNAFLLKGVYTAEHGYIIYIGSHIPFSIDDQMPITLNRPISSIVVELTAI